MPNCDPRDGFFYPTLTLMIDSYTVYHTPLHIIMVSREWWFSGWFDTHCRHCVASSNHFILCLVLVQPRKTGKSSQHDYIITHWGIKHRHKIVSDLPYCDRPIASNWIRPDPIAQSVSSPTADPGVASLIPSRSHTFVEIDCEIISTVILLLRVVVIYINPLVKIAQDKSVVR